MPSANTKTDKNGSTEAPDPLRQAIVLVEHKIRNLEKRKAKLDTYRKSEKQLTRDIVDAVNKYDEVIHQLDLSREFVKQFTAISIDSEKAKKKAARKEALDRTTTEITKIKQVLLIQDALLNMGAYQAREDFLAGRNGAPLLTDADLKCLDDLFVLVSPKHEGPLPFLEQVKKAADNLLAIVDGKTRELAGTTCAKLQVLVNSIHDCGYFDQPSAGPTEEELEPVVEVQPVEPLGEVIVPEPEPPAPINTNVNNVAASLQVVPPQEGVPPKTMTQTPGLPPNIPKPTPLHPLVQNIVPVSQVESNIFNAQGFKPPNSNPPPPVVPPPITQNQRPPISEVMSRVGGKFTFFQDSELDIVDMSGPTQAAQPPPPSVPPAAIPSRTFTNQNFNGQPGPAPMGFPPAGAPANQYFVGGFQPQAPPHYSQEIIQGFPGAPQVVPNAPSAPAAPNNAIPIQNQRAAGESPNRGFPQPPQHMPSAFAALPNPPSNAGGPPVSGAPASFPTSNMPAPPEPAPEELPANEVKETEPQRQDWAERVDWANDEWTDWPSQGTDNVSKNSNAVKPRGGDRGDRPRNNYQNNRNGNRNNYSNNRAPRNNRDRESGSNGTGGGNYYTNMNGYQPRGDGQQRDNRDRDSKDGGYRRGGPSNRGPRNDRTDRPPQGGQGNSARRNNSGPRAPRNSNRGGPGGPPNAYRQESYVK